MGTRSYRPKGVTPQRTGTVVFHEFSREFKWHIPSATVYNEQGLIVATECWNLEMARTAARRTIK
jgi:hypothetical protein